MAVTVHLVNHESQELELRVEEVAVVVVVMAVVDGGWAVGPLHHRERRITNNFTCHKSSKLITLFLLRRL